MKIRKKIDINLEKLYSPPEIRRLYRENKISLIEYEDAIEFVKKNLKAIPDGLFGSYELVYNNKKLYFLNNGNIVYSNQILFYIKDSNNVALLCVTRHNNGCIKYTELSINFLENYKFMILT